ncbi:MAG: hypothetical protein IKK32_03610 [Oscillospiraceae bacterium]|nr:hypothetical protein [Oscillospiraceae bacterium]
MKKIFIVSLAVMMLMSFTACSKKEETQTPDTTTNALTEYTQDTEETEEIPDETIPEETEAPTETTVPEETTTPEETTVPADTTAEITTAATTVATTVAETTTAATTTQAVSAVSTVKGKGYSFKIDSAKWMDISAYIDTISKEAEKLGQNKVNISAEQIKAANDFIYFHANNRNVIINVASTKVGDTSKVDFSNAAVKMLFSETMREQYEKVGFTYVGDKVSTVAGKQCFVMTIEAPKSVVGGAYDAKSNAYVFFVGEYQYVVTYTAPKGEFDTYKGDFDAVLSTLAF